MTPTEQTIKKIVDEVSEVDSHYLLVITTAGITILEEILRKHLILEKRLKTIAPQRRGINKVRIIKRENEKMPTM